MQRKKRLLFLDDKLERWEALHKGLPEYIGFMCWVSSSKAAIHALEDGGATYDVICLDHDLADDDCGCAVVDWIVAHPELFKTTRFIIHSWNPDGAEVMHLALINAGLNSRRRAFHLEHIPV